MLVLSLPAFENKKYTAYDRFHGNGPYGPYGKIPTKKEPIRKLGFTLPYNNAIYYLKKRSHNTEHNELSKAIVLFPKTLNKRLSDTVFFWFLVLDIDTATAALNLVNGYLFKGKPVIIQYGKQRKDSSDKTSKNVNTPGTSST